MKAKIYPLENISNEVRLLSSSFVSHLAIICSSLAVGRSVLSNVASSNDIDVTIAWCKQIGANIERKGTEVIVDGFVSYDDKGKVTNRRKIDIKNSIFDCNNSLVTAKLMLPLLATFSQPVGIKGSNEIIKALHPFKEKLENCNVTYIENDELIRIERRFSTFKEDLNDDFDIYMATGIILAMPFIKGSSSITLHAPVNNYDDYLALIKFLRKYNIELKHPSSMVFEISSLQIYYAANYSIEMDSLNLCFLALLANKMTNDKKYKLKLVGYTKNTQFDIHKLVDVLKKNLFTVSQNKLKPKHVFNQTIDANLSNNVVPFEFIYGTIAPQGTLITKVKDSDQALISHIDTMSKIFKKFGFDAQRVENEIVINPCDVTSKKQIEADGDPYVAMALCYLALMSPYPLIIKDAHVIYNVDHFFFDQIKQLGGKIELIHN